VPLRIARGRSLFVACGLAAALTVIGNNSLQTAVAEGDTRTLSFHHVHTGEDLTVTFKRNGRYDDAALAKLNWFMRDWTPICSICCGRPTARSAVRHQSR
jgi:uncharacterized protein YcbK (DUF882 family)